ncbi:hypothetical protein ACVWXM_009541 [Bradyrhizobium sp. GM7.3]
MPILTVSIQIRAVATSPENNPSELKQTNQPDTLAIGKEQRAMTTSWKTSRSGPESVRQVLHQFQSGLDQLEFGIGFFGGGRPQCIKRINSHPTTFE